MDADAGSRIPNTTTASKAAVPQSANATTGNVVTKAGGVPAAGIAGPGAGNPLTGSGAEEGTNKFVPHDEPAK